MAIAYFGGSGSGSSTTRTGYTLTTGPIDLVGGRLAANGGVYARMTSLAALVAAYSGTVGVTATLGGGSAYFTVGNSGGLPGSYAGAGTNAWLFNGGSYNLVFSPSAQMRFNRGGGGASNDGHSVNYTGTVGGYYTYDLPPLAPTLNSATPSTVASGTVNISFTPSADDGGTAYTAYTIVRDGTIIANIGTTTYTDTGLTPGTSYSYTVRSRNAVTDAVGTQSVGSSAIAVVAPGAPTAPQTLTGSESTTVVGAIDLSWAAPATPGTGGITGYNIFRDGTQIATLTGAGTTYTATGLTYDQSYSWTVKARNAFSDSAAILSTASNVVSVVASSPPSAPLNLTSLADGLVPGRITLDWDAPADAQTGGAITGYNVYYSTGVLAQTLTGTTSDTAVTGLNPGQTYSFYIKARNVLSDNSGVLSPQSNTTTVQALGEPPAPDSFGITASTQIAGRISMSWTPPAGSNTGFSVFEHNNTTNVDTLIAIVKTGFYSVDNLAPGVTKYYFVRTRNSYTDTLAPGYPGNFGGPASSTLSATPASDTSQTVPLVVAASDTTNTNFNGTYIINAVTPTTVRYAKVATNVTATAVSAGTILNNTNTTLNGSYTIASTPTPATLTYAKVAANIASATVSGATVIDTTNASFNGTFVVTAVNVGAKTISYARSGPAVASASVPINALPGGRGTISNQTNAVYNGTNLAITGITTLTITYAKVNANISESNAAGTVTDTTNRDYYNGPKVITNVPSYNTLTFGTVGPNQASTTTGTPPQGITHRAASPAELDIKYRSGWAG